MGYDLAVVGQDPRFGGGALAQTEAFLTAAQELGRRPEVFYEPHPGIRGPRWTWRRVEALRQLAATRTFNDELRDARSLWIVATLAHFGSAAPRTGRRYGCWIGTTIDSEWHGRAPGLTLPHRAAAGLSLPLLIHHERRVLEGATSIYATGAASRAEVALAAGRAEHEIGVLPIPINVERFSPAPESAWRAALLAPVLTFVGRANDPRKNVELLLDAFVRLRRARPTARLRLVGTPPDVAVPIGVEVVGVVDDVAAELRRAAIFVLPSRQEGFGIAVAEALAAGLPAIVTPCGGPEELIRASGGGLVLQRFDAKELAEALATVSDEPSAATAMRDAARTYVVRTHDQRRFVELLARAFRQLDGD